MFVTAEVEKLDYQGSRQICSLEKVLGRQPKKSYA